jgi:hypothetical protein
MSPGASSCRWSPVTARVRRAGGRGPAAGSRRGVGEKDGAPDGPVGRRRVACWLPGPERHPVRAGCRFVELGGIEPPSAERLPTALRPFPRFTALRLPHRRVGGPRGGGRRRVFPRCQRSFPPPAVFPAANHRFCCRAAVIRPRVPSLVAGCSRSPELSGGEGVLLIGSCGCAPFKESEQLRSHDSTSGLDVETDQPLVKQPHKCTGRT